jgi:hypothetical protein
MDMHSNLHEGKGSGSFTEPLYYAGHKQKLEALIDLFHTRGVRLSHPSCAYMSVICVVQRLVSVPLI